MKEELRDWKTHPVTQEVFIELKRRVEGLKEELASQALDADPRVLAFKAGAIQAFQDILDVEL